MEMKRIEIQQQLENWSTTQNDLLCPLLCAVCLSTYAMRLSYLLSPSLTHTHTVVDRNFWALMMLLLPAVDIGRRSHSLSLFLSQLSIMLQSYWWESAACTCICACVNLLCNEWMSHAAVVVVAAFYWQTHSALENIYTHGQQAHTHTHIYRRINS